MKIASGKALSRGLRGLARSVQRRLWISSPFVGGWTTVQCLLDLLWQNNGIDVKLLTDIENPGALNAFTIRKFESHGQIKHLRGLHAKVFIIDDRALVTSANLTETAFARRYEIGIFLNRDESQPIIKLFNDWWDSKFAEIPPDGWTAKLRTKHKSGEKESSGRSLRTINSLPPTPVTTKTARLSFGDYAAFLSCYRQFAETYMKNGQRVWPLLPLYLETDAFLNFLFNDAPKRPSKKFEARPPRNFRDAQRIAEVRKYKKAFTHWIHTDSRAQRYKSDRESTWRLVRTLLSKRRIDKIKWPDVAKIVGQFHSMKAVDINPARFLKPANNDLTTIKRAWKNVLYPDGVLLESAMRQCADKLYGFGKSNVQELVGWHNPKLYPIRNKNSNAGLRFFGYKVSAR